MSIELSNVISRKVRNDAPVRLAVFGPSTADNAINVCGMESSYPVFPGSGSTVYYPCAGEKIDVGNRSGVQIVGCGGKTGETVGNSYDRFKAVYSAGRKSGWDVVNTQPDVLLYRSCAINDIIGMVAAPSDATLTALAEKELSIVKYFISNGVPVVYTGVLGYSAVVSQELLDIRRGALVVYNAKIQAFVNRMFLYVSAVGVLSDSSGVCFANMFYDGVHMTPLGGATLGREEIKAINKFCVSRFVPKNLYDSAKAMGNADGDYTATVSGSATLTNAVVGATECQYDVYSPIGGTVNFAWLLYPAESVFVAGSTYRIQIEVELLDALGNHVDYDDDILMTTRALCRNSANANITFDSPFKARSGMFSMPMHIPTGTTIQLNQFYIKLDFAVEKTMKIKVKPLTISKIN